jgi:epsin
LANQVYDQGVKALSKTETERRLAEALSHANWGASTTLMWEIAQATSDVNEFQVIMREIWAACASNGRNWRVCYKGLALLEFLLKNGHKRVLEEAKDNRSKIRKLETFSYLRDGVEKGTGVREKAKAVTELLDDEDLLKRERAEAAKLRTKFTGVGRDGPGGGFGSGFDDDDREKVGSDISDDEDEDSKKKSKKKGSKKKSSKKKGSDDEDEDVAGSDDDDFQHVAKPKSKKKQESDEEEEEEKPKKKTSSKTSSISKKKTQEEASDDDFGFDDHDDKKKKASSKASSISKKKTQEEPSDDDFGFDDDDKKKKPTTTTTSSQVKAGPLQSISVKLPGTGGSGSTNGSNAAATKSKKDEVNLLGDFDPFGTSSTSSAPSTTQAAKPPQQQQAADILNMFNTPVQAPAAAPSANTFGGFPSSFPNQSSFQQQGFPPMGGMAAAPMASTSTNMFGGSSQPMMMPSMGQQPMMMPQMGQQPMMMPQMGQQPLMMPQMAQPPMMMHQIGQQPMMMPQMGQQPMMMGQPMMGTGQAQTSKKPDAQKKDAFSGLMDFMPPTTPSSSGPAKPPPTSLI